MNSPQSSSQPVASARPAAPEVAARAGVASTWDKEEQPWPPSLSAAEAKAFRGERTAPSPWRVVLVQAQVGAVIALLIGVCFGRQAAWSALYGAATAFVPSGLMARGTTRMIDVRSPMVTALNLLAWESMKIICSAGMLFMCPRVLHPVVWPALLAALTGCLMVYWVALAWRSR